MEHLEAYKDHVIDQALTVLSAGHDIQAMFATPKLLESLCLALEDRGQTLADTGIKGIFSGGTEFTPQWTRFAVEELLDGVYMTPTYGNTLMGLAASRPVTAEDGYTIAYYAPQPRAVLEVVDPDDPDQVVDYGATGRVRLTTLTREFFVPGFLERDEGEREQPWVDYPWDGVSGVRPFARLASATTVGGVLRASAARFRYSAGSTTPAIACSSRPSIRPAIRFAAAAGIAQRLAVVEFDPLELRRLPQEIVHPPELVLPELHHPFVRRVVGLAAAIEHLALGCEHLGQIAPHQDDPVVQVRRQVLEQEGDDLDCATAGRPDPGLVRRVCQVLDPLVFVVAPRVVLVGPAPSVGHDLHAAGLEHLHRHRGAGARKPRDDRDRAAVTDTAPECSQAHGGSDARRVRSGAAALWR